MSVEESSTNPYQSSPLLPTSVDRNLLSWRIIWRLIAIVVFCTFIGGLLGASAGLFLAILFPSYYAGVFELRSTGIADAVPLGVGLGLSQGIGGGALVGLAIDAIDRHRVPLPSGRPHAGSHAKYAALRHECGAPQEARQAHVVWQGAERELRRQADSRARR